MERVGFLFSLIWKPYDGVLPMIALASAIGPPSRFVIAPKTEFAYITADDSAQAKCSPYFGIFSSRYGVQVHVDSTPISFNAEIIFFCFKAKSSGIPISFQLSRSMPVGLMEA